jgi:hypothetical protein
MGEEQQRVENSALTSSAKPSDPSQLVLLRRVVQKRKPEQSARLSELWQHPLTDTEREMYREIVADEFAEAGLQANDEPTGYGLALESVIDWLSHV